MDIPPNTAMEKVKDEIKLIINNKLTHNLSNSWKEKQINESVKCNSWLECCINKEFKI